MDERFFDCALRVERDLRTRFPQLTVQLVFDPEDGWVCDVHDGLAHWGWVGTWAETDAVPTPLEVEDFTTTLACDVADNLWPDELMDPWPLCPTHGDHPLNPQLANRRAVWACARDSRVAIPIGELGKSVAGRGGAPGAL